ncbi:MAG: chemotaxis response regulator protein-glutamate methylesterase [Spirochaetaceae bacterium]|jgi:two-component system chemotaxis response regulator CheB|nr:chemotaxis response regulator protein-glutamate methylesterase [Spirochaetaceae bacterium]
MADEIGVLVVDDSALMRNLISKMVEDTPGLKVAGTAMNGKFALQKIQAAEPDVICLDIEMPEMNGIEFLREWRKKAIGIPVIVLSSVAEKGAAVTVEALTLGASDFIQKPGGSVSLDIANVKDQLTPLLVAWGTKWRKKNNKPLYTPSAAPPVQSAEGQAGEKGARSAVNIHNLLYPKAAAPKPVTPLRRPANTEIVAIGISTGGPDALRTVFSRLDPDLKVPILVVQHMPPGFTAEFAKSLDRICPLEVKEAAEGDVLKPGQILIAQGARHLEIEKKGTGGTIAHITETPPVSGHRPSADVLFASVAMAYQNHALGVIMTGMGSDGAHQLGTIMREGGLTIGQDEATAVVYGMPRVAHELGHVQEQVPLDKMGRRISQIVKTQR